MRTRLLATLACWLSLSALLPAQPINPGASVKLPVYPVPDQDASIDECENPGTITNPTFYFSLDTLYWWTKPGPVDRAIVGTLHDPSADYGAFPGAGGVNDPNTIVMFGNQRVHHDGQFGIRGTGQIAFDDMNVDVIELVGMYLPRQSQTATFAANPNGISAVALLFNDVSGGVPGVSSAFPVVGFVNGTFLQGGGVIVDTYSEMWGAEFNLSHRLTPRHSPFYGEVMIGYRHQGLREGMSITAITPSTGTAFEDTFKTTNLFNGAQFGARAGAEWWHLSIMGTAKAAFGVTDMTVNIENTNFGTGTPSLYVQPSNFGRTGTSRFGFVGELGATGTWAITPNVSLSAGYNYLYWNRVVRATNQIDTNLNLNQQNGQPDPGFPIRRDQRSEFWAHGIVTSLEFSY
jgi:hypothetical protein